MQVQVYMFVSVCQACTFIMDISIIIKFEEHALSLIDFASKRWINQNLKKKNCG